MISLEEEAKILSPIVNDWFTLVTEKKIPEPHKWSCGKFPTPLADSEKYYSSKLADIPHILPMLTERYLIKLFGVNYSEISVISIFEQIRFTGIKKNSGNFVNQCLVSWALNKRPFVLLKEIPTPLQVLRMQATGHRVATAFLSFEELSSHHIAKLHYMEGHQNHSKDAFEFFVHDLIHMEHFTDPNTYQEQTGFFYSLLSMSSDTTVSPKKFIRAILNRHTFQMVSGSQLVNTLPFEEIFKSHFQQLWHELEYLISDMNCYLPHLMKYLIAKLTINCHLLYREIWKQVLVIRKASADEAHEDLSPPVLVIPSFACYLRNLWIELIRGFQISSENPESGENPFTACMSMMNHSLEHSPRHSEDEQEQELEIALNSSVCVCGECDRHTTTSLSIRDEGEFLRTHFQAIAISTGILPLRDRRDVWPGVGESLCSEIY